jgi:hypothetical protein
VSQGTARRQLLPGAALVLILPPKERARMGTPADYTILVLLVAIGVGLWTVLDRINQLQRDVEDLKRKNGVIDPPAAD